VRRQGFFLLESSLQVDFKRRSEIGNVRLSAAASPRALIARHRALGAGKRTPMHAALGGTLRRRRAVTELARGMTIMNCGQALDWQGCYLYYQYEVARSIKQLEKNGIALLPGIML